MSSHPSSGRFHPTQLNTQPPPQSPAEIASAIADFRAKDVYLSSVATRVTPLEFYRDLFPEDFLEECAVPQTDDNRRPVGIAHVIRDPDQRGRTYNRLIFRDLSMITELQHKETVYIAPIGYSGRHALAKYAYTFFGMTFDLDDVGVENIEDLLYQMENGILPQCSYIVNSGGGLHVYYLYEDPVPAFQRYYAGLNNLKAALSDLIWNAYTSRSKVKQHQGIFQSFRMPGSQTKFSADCIVSVYRVGPKITVHALNGFVDDKHKSDFDDLNYYHENDAKERWPEWAARRDAGIPAGVYELTGAQRLRRRSMYEKWLERIKKEAVEGQRYGCIGVLFNYAFKADIPFGEVYEDAMSLVPMFNKLTKRLNNEFTEYDVKCASVYYDKKYAKIGRKGIKAMSGLDIGRKEAKGISRDDTFENAKLRRDQLSRKYGHRIEGRKSKQQIIIEWKLRHPDGNKADCIRDTGISKPTVYKWWDDENKVRLSDADIVVSAYLTEHPDASINDCASATGYGESTVYRVRDRITDNAAVRTLAGNISDCMHGGDVSVAEFDKIWIERAQEILRKSEVYENEMLGDDSKILVDNGFFEELKHQYGDIFNQIADTGTLSLADYSRLIRTPLVTDVYESDGMQHIRLLDGSSVDVRVTV